MSRRAIRGSLVWCSRLVLLIGFALLLARLVEPIEPDFSPIFLGAIALATWRWGFRAGILGTLLSCLSMLYLFLPPYYAPEIPSWPVFLREVSFVVTATLIIWLVRSFASAERALRASTHNLQASLQEIRTREERLRVALRKTPVVVFHQNTNLSYLWVYNPFREHVDTTMVGKTDLDLFPPDEAAQLTRIKERVLASGAGAREEVKLTTQGELRTLDLTVEPFRDPTGNLLGLLGTAVDITDRQRNEQRLRDSREQLRSLAAHLQSLREEERALTSREIHDHVAQMLAALEVQLGVMALQLSQGADPAVAVEQIKALSGLLAATIASSERISSGLRPSLLDNLGLAAALQWQAREFQSRTGIRVVFTEAVRNISTPAEVSTAVFRIFQEVLTDVERHSEADQVRIDLHREGQAVILRIRDNGRGITEDQTTAGPSLEILEMHERARLFGGKISIHGIPGEGTTVCVAVPIQDREGDPGAPATSDCAVLSPDGTGDSPGSCPIDGSDCLRERPLE